MNAALAQPDDPDASQLEAWVMDEDESTCSLPHRRSPNAPVSARALAALGVLSWHLPPGTGASEKARLAAFRHATALTRCLPSQRLAAVKAARGVLARRCCSLRVN